MTATTTTVVDIHHHAGGGGGNGGIIQPDHSPANNLLGVIIDPVLYARHFAGHHDLRVYQDDQDRHNDSGYSTRPGESSQGPSPSLSGIRKSKFLFRLKRLTSGKIKLFAGYLSRAGRVDGRRHDGHRHDQPSIDPSDGTFPVAFRPRFGPDVAGHDQRLFFVQRLLSPPSKWQCQQWGGGLPSGQVCRSRP